MSPSQLRVRNYLHSLHGKFTLILLGTATLLAVLAAMLGFQMALLKARESAQTTLEAMLSAIEKTAAVGVYAQDHVLLDELIKGVARDPNVARVWVEDAHGQLLSESRPGAGPGVPAWRPDDHALLLNRRLTSPFDGSEELGQLKVLGDSDHIANEAQQLARWLAGALAVLISVLALVLNHGVLSMLSKPMMRLTHKLASVEPGSAQRLTLAKRHSKDEVGTVITAVNSLLGATESALQAERQMRAEIAAMEAQYRQIFDHTSAGIFVLTSSGRLINGNPTVMRVIGADSSQLAALRGEDFVQKVFADPAHVHKMIADASTLGQTMSADLALRADTGEPRWVHCLISVQEESAALTERMVEGVIYDVTQRKSQESAASHQAQHDGLTGLKNRHGIAVALDQMLQQAQMAGHAVTLIFLDLDGFKKVNDELGHEAGDEVLVECGKRLSALLRRSGDLAGRLGGDEMVLLLDRIDAEAPVVQELAQNLLNAIQQPIALRDGRQAQVGASIGLASYPLHALHRAGLFNAADAAMYEVKRHGKNAWRVAPPLSPA